MAGTYCPMPLYRGCSTTTLAFRSWLFLLRASDRCCRLMRRTASRSALSFWRYHHRIALARRLLAAVARARCLLSTKIKPHSLLSGGRRPTFRPRVGPFGAQFWLKPSGPPHSPRGGHGGIDHAAPSRPAGSAPRKMRRQWLCAWVSAAGDRHRAAVAGADRPRGVPKAREPSNSLRHPAPT